MATRIYKLEGLPVLILGDVKYICPEITIVGKDPIFVTERLARYINRMANETRYDVHVFHRGDTIDSYNERNGRCFAQYAIAAKDDEPGHVLAQAPSGLVKINVSTGETRILR